VAEFGSVRAKHGASSGLQGADFMLNVAIMGRYGPPSGRYAILQVEDRRAVLDVWTGEPVVIGAVPQTDLNPRDAEELVDYLKRRALRGWDLF